MAALPNVFDVYERKARAYPALILVSTNLRRDRYIRDRLREGDPPWHVEGLRAPDLARGRELVAHLRHIAGTADRGSDS